MWLGAPTQGFDVAFYGDSIFEHWLGTSQGTPWKQSEAVVSQYERAFGNASDFSSRVLAIAGALCSPFVHACKTATETTEALCGLLCRRRPCKPVVARAAGTPLLFAPLACCSTGRLWCRLLRLNAANEHVRKRTAMPLAL